MKVGLVIARKVFQAEQVFQNPVVNCILYVKVNVELTNIVRNAVNNSPLSKKITNILILCFHLSRNTYLMAY